MLGESSSGFCIFDVGLNSKFIIENSKFPHGFSQVVLTMDVRIFWILEACFSSLSAL
jgi:hypothetical protein